MTNIFKRFWGEAPSAPSAPKEALTEPAPKRKKTADERSPGERSEWARKMAALSAESRRKRKAERSRPPAEALKSNEPKDKQTA